MFLGIDALLLLAARANITIKMQQLADPLRIVLVASSVDVAEHGAQPLPYLFRAGCPFNPCQRARPHILLQVSNFVQDHCHVLLSECQAMVDSKDRAQQPFVFHQHGNIQRCLVHRCAVQQHEIRNRSERRDHRSNCIVVPVKQAAFDTRHIKP